MQNACVMPSFMNKLTTHPLVWWVQPVDVLPHTLAGPVGKAGLEDSLCHHALADAIAL
jgi:hypothetical protein